MAHHKIISVYTSPLGHLALPDISNPILYLSTLSDQDKTSPVALSLIRYYNLPVKQLWEAIRVSKETLQPPFLPRLYSNGHSHVAILDNGGVVAWGGPDYGGRTPEIPEGRTVRSVYSNTHSHVAILDNGRVVAWGGPSQGGSTPEIPEGRIVSSVSSSNTSPELFTKKG